MRLERGAQALTVRLALVVALCAATGIHADEPAPGERIVLILADDLGYGDIGSYNPRSQIQTLRMDRLAEEGMRFTDAHSPSAVCTPTRYALLTGRYAWRTRLKSGVLFGYSPLLIAPGPNEVGFDYFFGIPASLDMKPYVYVENGRPVRLLTGRLVEAGESRRGGGSGFWRKGEIAEGFDHESVLPTLTERRRSYCGSGDKPRRQAVFSVLRVDGAAHAVASGSAVPGYERRRTLRRLRCRRRQRRWTSDGCAGARGRGRSNPLDFDLGQWRSLDGQRQAGIRSSGQRFLAGSEGGHPRRGSPRSPDHPMAGKRAGKCIQ